MRIGRSWLAAGWAVLFVLVGGCGTRYGALEGGGADTMQQERSVAVAVVRPTAGHSVSGVVTFTDLGEGGVRVRAHVTGLNAGQKHGFHLHEFGDARSSDGTSAGGHYDPEHTGYHARPNAERRHHAGDLGNLQANEKGVASYNLVRENISVDGEHNPILGRAVIVHAKPDDFGQPTGNAGARIGIGVIGSANPKL